MAYRHPQPVVDTIPGVHIAARDRHERSRTVREDALHWMDRVQAWALRRRICFQDGWGDLSVAPAIARDLAEPPPLEPIRPEVGAPTRVLGADLRVGHFVSPDDRLPPESRTARFWWLHPADQAPRGAVCVLASWGDEGPTMRGRLVGQLVREGISIVILENPFYGCRRRDGQRAQGLRTVSDFLLMQGAAFREARGLLAWTRREVGAPVACVGFSMGGHLAAGIGAAFRGEVPLVTIAPPRCPSEPFTAGPLGRCIDWEALGGPTEATFARWTALMDTFDVLHLRPPGAQARIRILGALEDGLVPSHHAALLARAWNREVEWHPVGHVAIALTRTRAVRRAIKDVLGLPVRDRRPALTGEVEATA